MALGEQAQVTLFAVSVPVKTKDWASATVLPVFWSATVMVVWVAALGPAPTVTLSTMGEVILAAVSSPAPALVAQLLTAVLLSIHSETDVFAADAKPSASVILDRMV